MESVYLFVEFINSFQGVFEKEVLKTMTDVEKNGPSNDVLKNLGWDFKRG